MTKYSSKKPQKMFLWSKDVFAVKFRGGNVLILSNMA